MRISTRAQLHTVAIQITFLQVQVRPDVVLMDDDMQADPRPKDIVQGISIASFDLSQWEKYEQVHTHLWVLKLEKSS